MNETKSHQHTWASDGFCIYCHNVHITDRNARSTCSDGFRCKAETINTAIAKVEGSK